MKVQVRKQVFETNSSSTHSIAIATEHLVDDQLPEKCIFEYGEFGWEVDTVETTQEKASYLYTSLFYVLANEKDDLWKQYITFIFETLTKHGVACEFKGEIKDDIYAYTTSNGEPVVRFYHNIDGYVDHGNDTAEFVNAVCTNEDLLLSFLFSKKSFILTGNDNDELDVDIHVDYPYVEFYKGN